MCIRDRLGITSLFVASKYEEIYPPELHDFSKITDYTYTKEEIMSQERLLLTQLSFNINCPTILFFLNRFVKVAGCNKKETLFATYLAELTLIDAQMNKWPPSRIAAASVYVSMKMIEPAST